MVTFLLQKYPFYNKPPERRIRHGDAVISVRVLQKKYLFIIVQSQPHFDDESWLEHLRDFIAVVVEAIYNEPAVRALGKSRSELVFRIFWVLAPQYEPYGRRYCLPSKSDVLTDIFGFLHDLQNCTLW